jgi:hypothetical protein
MKRRMFDGDSCGVEPTAVYYCDDSRRGPRLMCIFGIAWHHKGA